MHKYTVNISFAASTLSEKPVKKSFADCTTRTSIVMGSGSVLIGSRSQAATSIQAVRPDSISQTGTTTCLCRLTFIVVQQPAQPFPTAHLFSFSWDCWSPQGDKHGVLKSRFPGLGVVSAILRNLLRDLGLGIAVMRIVRSFSKTIWRES